MVILKVNRMLYRRILVRATNWVGDAIMSLPALYALRSRFPNAHMAILARPSVADIYMRELFADEVIPYGAPRGWRGAAEQYKLARHLNEANFDCAILFQNAFEAAALAWMARIPQRIGYDRDARGLLLTRAVAVPRDGEIPAHQRFYYLELLKRAGILDSYPADAEVRLAGAAAAAERGRELFAKRGVGGVIIGVSPGAAFGGAKRWLPERFSESAVRLARELEGTVAVFGTPDEAALASRVADSVAAQSIPVVNVAGRTSLRDFIDMAAACRLFLTNDSGSMHVASALGVPTVVVFGPTDEHATGPAGHAYAIVREPVECAPCHRRECPIDHRCMTRVSADQVAEAALKIVR
jgi:heptosyltransferase-2